MSEPLLDLQEVHTSYGAIKALRGISLTVHEGETVAERVDTLLAFRNSTAARRIRRRLVDADGRLDENTHRELLRLMEGSFRLRTRLAPGVTLVEFLRAAVSEASGPVDVVVTGHSKGGALAPTLALAQPDRPVLVVTGDGCRIALVRVTHRGSRAR